MIILDSRDLDFSCIRYVLDESGQPKPQIKFLHELQGVELG